VGTVQNHLKRKRKVLPKKSLCSPVRKGGVMPSGRLLFSEIHLYVKQGSLAQTEGDLHRREKKIAIRGKRVELHRRGK